MKTKLNFWVTEEEKQLIEQNQHLYKFNTLSEYIRFVSINSKITVESCQK